MKFNHETITTLGSIKLASGTITDPVEFFDISLPAGYMSFHLFITGYAFFSYPDNMAFVLSFDGGTTFANDTNNNDTYRMAIIPQTTELHVRFNYSQILTDYSEQSGRFNTYIIEHLLPGGSGVFAHGLTRVMHDDGSVSPEIGGFALNPSATVTPAAVRANLIRVLPSGFGDCDPPTSGNTITAGSWALFGVPNSS